MWHSHDGPDGWGLLWMSLLMAIVWLPLLLILVWALREFARPHRGEQPPGGQPLGGQLLGGQPPEPDAREIARRSYARGEIDREHYLQIIEDLDHTGG